MAFNNKTPLVRILAVFSLFAIFTMILRFKTYEPNISIGNPPHRDCLEKSQPRIDKDGFEIVVNKIRCEIVDQINRSYLDQVKPIFEQKCLMCHGPVKRLPLYAAIPPSSFLVKWDISEAKEHMDMTFDFPFVGHGSIQDDLKAVQKIVEKGEMPPFQYKMMHWQSGLNDQEKETILGWTEQSLREINQ